MSRYLVQLARQTRSKLRLPSSLRLAPHATTIFEEIHEERLVGPALPIREFAKAAPGAVTEQTVPSLRSRESFIAPISPPPQTSPMVLPLEARHFQPTKERQVETTRLSTPESIPPEPTEPPRVKRQDDWEARLPLPVAERRTASVPLEQSPARPMSPKAGPASRAPSQPGREIQREILETAVHAEYFLDDVRPFGKEPQSIAEFSIPEPVRTWLRLPPEKPAPSPTRAQPLVPMPQPEAHRIAPPVIDVTIGKIEVTIENEAQPPLRAARRAEPRAAAPPRPASPAIGRLARQYLDR